MKHKEFDRRIKENLANYKRDVLKIEESGSHNGKTEEYILPDGVEKNFIDNSFELFKKYFDKNITNIYSNHLCSSQVMCMNFFIQLVNDEKLFNQVVKSMLNLEGEIGDIKKIDFNYNLEEVLKGEVNLYLELEDGKKIYIQTNYMESTFGEFFDNQKTSAWNEVYSEFVQGSLYLKDIEKDDFYKEYQLNRNIGLIKNESDYAIFIYPFENDSLRDALKDNVMKNVIKIDWNELTYKVLNMVKDKELEDYYREFSRKYLNY